MNLKDGAYLIDTRSWAKYAGKTHWQAGTKGGEMVHTSCGGVIHVDTIVKPYRIATGQLALGAIGYVYCVVCDKRPTVDSEPVPSQFIRDLNQTKAPDLAMAA